MTRTGRASAGVIAASHELHGDLDRLIACYRDWAHYDEDVEAEHYVGPEFMVALVVDLLADPTLTGVLPGRDELRILDAGCGTGRVGRAAQAAGLPDPDGLDLSPDRIKDARDTGAYRTLRVHNMLEPLPAIFVRRHHVYLCCGTFTTGHVPEAGLDTLVAAAAPDCLILASTPNTYLEDEEYAFAERVDALVARGVVSVHALHEDQPYIDGRDASYWVLRRTSPEQVDHG